MDHLGSRNVLILNGLSEQEWPDGNIIFQYLAI